MTPALDVSFMLNGIHNSPQDSMRHATLTHATKLSSFFFSYFKSVCLSVSHYHSHYHSLLVL